GGIATAGGAGRALAEWIIADRPPMDLWQADIRRFAPFHANPTFLRERVSEIVGVHYFVAFPNRELESGRGLRRSPLYERLQARGACFGSKMGWALGHWLGPGRGTHGTQSPCAPGTPISSSPARPRPRVTRTGSAATSPKTAARP